VEEELELAYATARTLLLISLRCDELGYDGAGYRQRAANSQVQAAALWRAVRGAA